MTKIIRTHQDSLDHAVEVALSLLAHQARVAYVAIARNTAMDIVTCSQVIVDLAQQIASDPADANSMVDALLKEHWTNLSELARCELMGLKDCALALQAAYEAAQQPPEQGWEVTS